MDCGECLFGPVDVVVVVRHAGDGEDALETRAVGPVGEDEEVDVMREDAAAASRSPADELGERLVHPFVGPLFTVLLLLG